MLSRCSEQGQNFGYSRFGTTQHDFNKHTQFDRSWLLSHQHPSSLAFHVTCAVAPMGHRLDDYDRRVQWYVFTDNVSHIGMKTLTASAST